MFNLQLRTIVLYSVLTTLVTTAYHTVIITEAQQCPPCECGPCPPKPTPVTESTTDKSSANHDGSHRGAGTIQILTGILRDIEEANNLEPGLLGSADQQQFFVASNLKPLSITHLSPLTQKQKEVVCKGQAMVKRHQDFQDAKLMLSTYFGNFFAVPPGSIYTALGSPAYCAEVLPTKVSMYGRLATIAKKPTPKEDVVITVDAQGVPVSTNKAWNACIRGTVLQDVSGNPYSCRRYHSGIQWYHPDYKNVEITYLERGPRGLTVPDTFEVVTLEDKEEMQVAEVQELNRPSITSLISRIINVL